MPLYFLMACHVEFHQWTPIQYPSCITSRSVSPHLVCWLNCDTWYFRVEKVQKLIKSPIPLCSAPHPPPAIFLVAMCVCLSLLSLRPPPHMRHGMQTFWDMGYVPEYLHPTSHTICMK